VYELLFPIASALSLACVIYLARHYIRARKVVTLLLVVFFAMFSLTWIGYFLIATGVFQFDIVTYILYVSLVDFGVILLIGLVMIKLKELYLLPPSIILIAYFHEFALSTNRDQTIGIIQFLSYLNFRQLIGYPPYVILNSLFDFSFLEPYNRIFDALFSPLSILIPRIDIMIVSIYLFVFSAPTIILFYYLAWKNRSGRSLGFALGLSVLNLNLIFGIGEDVIALTTLVGTFFFALGILGIFDRIAKTGYSETR
jgi:hypothetical protein